MLRECPRCGLHNQPGDSVCVRCGLRLRDDFAAARAVSPVPSVLVSATFTRRALARAADMVICSLVSGVLAAALLMALGADMGVFQADVTQRGRGMWLTQLAMMISYHGIAESLGGATLGKLLLSLRVVGEDGGRIGLRRGLVRNAWVLIDGFLFGLVALVAMHRSPQGQRIGDRHAHTLVLQRRDVPSGGLASARSIAHGVVVGFAFAGALYALGLLWTTGQGGTGPTA